jgi:hypothetical protein
MKSTWNIIVYSNNEMGVFKISIKINQTEQFHYLTYEQMNIINQFRQLAMDFVTWDRALAEAIRFNNANIDADFERLLKVPYDIYDTMSTFYGKATAEQYTAILTQQAIAFTNLVKALNNNDTQAADEALKQWYELADEHATFYAKLSPYWSKEQWRLIVYQFIGAIYYGVLAMISGDYNKEIEIFDYANQIAISMADYASRGVMLNLSTTPSIPYTSKGNKDK